MQLINLQKGVRYTRFELCNCRFLLPQALKLNRASSEQTAPGQVVNLLSNDVNRFDLVSMFLHWLWLTPIHVAVLTWLIWQQVGIASLAGTVSMFFMSIPIQGKSIFFSSKNEVVLYFL